MVMLFTIFAAAILGLCSPAEAAVSVDCAYFHVDTGGAYSWTEATPGLADFAVAGRRSGTLKVYVRNHGKQPVAVEARELNGTGLEVLRTSERHEVIWWRTWPDPVPAGGISEVSVRLRYPLEEDAFLTLETGSETLPVTVPAVPPPFRIETVAWADGGRRVTLVARQFGPAPVRISRVLVDGADVTRRARIPAPEFSHGICPIEIVLPAAQAIGSFHTYQLAAADGAAAACTLRTLDEFLRLGMYGASDLDANVRLGINCAGYFRALDRAALDRCAAYGQRAAFHIGPVPAPEVRGHPAVHAYILHDEPDCWDYSAGKWPPPMRIGYHAPQIVADARRCVEADPARPIQVTLDLTFKPANYFVYAQIPDIVTPDCYPLNIGASLAMVRETTAVCRQAAGPRRVEAVPQVDFEDRKKEEMKFRRAPFGREVIIQYLYALGAGARGFSGWEWFDEDSDFARYYGAPNFPDVLDALGQTYRRFKLLQPLILKAHPAPIAACGDAKVWLQTLVCGLDALLLVAVNDDYQSLPTDFLHTPRGATTLTVPNLPWLRAGYAGLVGDGLVTPLPLAPDGDGCRVTLPGLDTGALVLIASDAQLADRLVQGYLHSQAQAALHLLRGARLDQARQAEEETAKRHIMGRYSSYMAEVAKPLAAYRVAEESFMNPLQAEYPALEWWTEQTPRGGEWNVTIPAERAGMAHRLYFQMARWWGGGRLRIEAADTDGKVIVGLDQPVWEGPIPNVKITFPAAGDYAVRILQVGEGKPGGRLNRCLYLVPANAAPLPGATETD